MKRYIWFLVISFGLLAVGSLQAATRYDIHHVGAYVGGGYSGMVNSYDNMRFIGGGGGMLGVSYEYHYKRFMLSVGPEFRLFSSKDVTVTDSIPYVVSYDYQQNNPTYPYPQTKYYAFSQLKETQLIGQLMVPIMAGANFDEWFFLGGVKVGYTLLRNYSQEALLTTSLTDAEAYEEWFEMLNHGLVNSSPYAQKGKTNFGFDMTLSLEAGVNIDKLLPNAWQKDNEKRERPLRMRASAFIDYGLPNMNIGQGTPLATAGPDIATTQSIHQSDWATSRVNSLLVGVKFTALLQLNKPKGKRAPNPRMVACVLDESTGSNIAGARVVVYNERTKRNAVKTTNKTGYVVTRYAPGAYQLTPQKAGYLPAQPTAVMHEADLRDTIVLTLTPEPIFSCVVRDMKTQNPLAVKLEFVDNASGKVAFTANTDSVNGKASLKLKYGNTYTVKISAPDYLIGSEQITNVGDNVVYMLEPVVKGTKIILQNLYFASFQTTILPESEGALQDLYTLLNENPDIRIRIIGHTDNVGTDKDNQILSEGRTASVKSEMVGRGIDASRIETEGRGEKEPIATNETEEGRAQNRRVEFMIL